MQHQRHAKHEFHASDGDFELVVATPPLVPPRARQPLAALFSLLGSFLIVALLSLGILIVILAVRSASLASHRLEALGVGCLFILGAVGYATALPVLLRGVKAKLSGRQSFIFSRDKVTNTIVLGRKRNLPLDETTVLIVLQTPDGYRVLVATGNRAFSFGTFHDRAGAHDLAQPSHFFRRECLGGVGNADFSTQVSTTFL
jgi:hypothetical protein